MNSELLKQLESRLKKKLGCSSDFNYENVVLLILLFMTSLDTICGRNTKLFTYFELLDTFLERPRILSVKPENYPIFLKNIGWATKYHVYSYTVLSDLTTLIKTKKLNSYNFG